MFSKTINLIVLWILFMFDYKCCLKPRDSFDVTNKPEPTDESFETTEGKTYAKKWINGKEVIMDYGKCKYFVKNRAGKPESLSQKCLMKIIDAKSNANAFCVKIYPSVEKFARKSMFRL